MDIQTDEITIGAKVAVTIQDWQTGETTVAGIVLAAIGEDHFKVEVAAGLSRHVFEVPRDHIALKPALVIEGRFGAERRRTAEPRVVAVGDPVTLFLPDYANGHFYAPGTVTRVYQGGRELQVSLGGDLRVLTSIDDVHLGNGEMI